MAEVFAQEEAEAQLVEDDKGQQDILSIEEELVALGLDDEEEIEIEVEETGVDIWNIQQLGADTGKIRFAEDLIDEYRDGRGKRRGDDDKGGRKNKKGAKARKR